MSLSVGSADAVSSRETATPTVSKAVGMDDGAGVGTADGLSVGFSEGDVVGVAEGSGENDVGARETVGKLLGVARGGSTDGAGVRITKPSDSFFALAKVSVSMPVESHRLSFSEAVVNWPS